ncbi:MAG: hypothetical protein EZS28_011981 [Streblomastix strix]|uniref:Uncharacterized protein n=1 Tax=Streblomastix strix TaxID=222440 RepID=A0A5J4WC05_9EUKA|nr:MAG: hypothetical protein EZS28_011981 [Streblomastix strix]
MALPNPKMEMFDQMNKLEKNKMFEIDAHSDAIWSIDESNQLNGLFAGIQIPPTGSKLTQTRIVSASSDGTVKLWNINTDGFPDQTDGNDVVYHKMLKEFKHTPSIASAVIKDWENRRIQAPSSDNQINNQSINRIEDKWEDSDIPTQVIFDPINVANLIVGYISGDLVRFDIEKEEYNCAQVGKRTEQERIISLTKSLNASHYQTQDTIPLLITTNHGYLHVVDSNNLRTIFSYKINNQQSHLQNPSIQVQTLPTIQPSQTSNINPRSFVLINKQRNVRNSSLQAWKDDIKQQFAAQCIFTSSTYLQFDCLIAASTNFGKVFMFDLRMADKGQVGILSQLSQFSQHQQMFSENITKIVAHPIHPVLVTAGADGDIKIFSSNPP